MTSSQSELLNSHPIYMYIIKKKSPFFQVMAWHLAQSQQQGIFHLNQWWLWLTQFNDTYMDHQAMCFKWLSFYKTWSCSITFSTHWGRVTQKCVSKLIIIGSDNGLAPGRHQAIIWTNAGILLIGPLGTNFSEILIEICTFSFRKMHLKMSSGKCRPFCLSLNVLTCVVLCGVRSRKISWYFKDKHFDW